MIATHLAPDRAGRDESFWSLAVGTSSVQKVH